AEIDALGDAVIDGEVDGHVLFLEFLVGSAQMLLVVQPECDVLQANLPGMLAVRIVADFGAGDFMMVAAVAGKKRNLELGQLHHELESQHVAEKLLGALEVAHLDYNMPNSVRQDHGWPPYFLSSPVQAA